MSQAEFAALIGMSRSAYGQVETGAINIGLEALVMISEHFHVSLNALILGNDQKPVNISSGISSIAVTVDSYGRERIVMVDLKARASYPAHRMEASYYKPLPSFSFPGEEFQQASFRCFEVEGDSMERTIYPGDWIIAKYIDLTVQAFKDGYVYVIITADDVLIKRVEPLKDSEVILHSDNSFYKPIIIDRSEIREAWLAVKKVSSNFTRHDHDSNQVVNAMAREILTIKEQIFNLENKL